MKLDDWIDTWAPNCGSSRAVFEGQFKAMLGELFDEIEEDAECRMTKTHKLEGMHYAALKAKRESLGLPKRKKVKIIDEF